MFITIEGLDASGKSTLTEKLKKIFEERGIKTNIISKKKIEYDEHDYIGKRLLELNNILFEISPGDDMTRIPNDAWVNMNAAWFSIVSNNYFRDNCCYISDSWIGKRVARFSLLDEYSIEQLEMIFGSAKKADMTFFLDVPPDETYMRREKHSRKDYGFLLTNYNLCTQERFLLFQGGIYKNLCKLSHKNGWIRLDGAKSQIEIITDALEYLEKANFLPQEGYE